MHCVSLVLERKLAGQAPALRAMAAEQHPPGAAMARAPSADATDAPPSPGAAARANFAAALGLAAPPPPLPSPPPRLPKPSALRGDSADSGALQRCHTDSSGLSSPLWVQTPRAASALPPGASEQQQHQHHHYSRRQTHQHHAPHGHHAARPVSAPISRVGSSSRLFKVASGKSISTEAMVSALSSEIRRRHARGAELRDIAIGERIGQGGFGDVFRGTYHRLPAAIKVLRAQQAGGGGGADGGHGGHGGGGGEAVGDAVEMAVLSSVSHPHVVQVFCCLTDVVEEPRSGAATGVWVER